MILLAILAGAALGVLLGGWVSGVLCEAVHAGSCGLEGIAYFLVGSGVGLLLGGGAMFVTARLVQRSGSVRARRAFGAVLGFAIGVPLATWLGFGPESQHLRAAVSAAVICPTLALLGWGLGGR